MKKNISIRNKLFFSIQLKHQRNAVYINTLRSPIFEMFRFQFEYTTILYTLRLSITDKMVDKR